MNKKRFEVINHTTCETIACFCFLDEAIKEVVHQINHHHVQAVDVMDWEKEDVRAFTKPLDRT